MVVHRKAPLSICASLWCISDISCTYSTSFSLFNSSALTSASRITHYFWKTLLEIITVIRIPPYWMKPPWPWINDNMWGGKKSVIWKYYRFKLNCSGLFWELLMLSLRSLEVSAVLCFLNLWEMLSRSWAMSVRSLWLRFKRARPSHSEEAMFSPPLFFLIPFHYPL